MSGANAMALDSEGEGAGGANAELDCYPYTFSPLLLFAESRYFDKGYSNYNSVAQFFSPALDDDVDMLENVLYDRKNMLYEALLTHIIERQMLVTCCIDAHFTAFQVLPGRVPSLLYYDPLKAGLMHVSGNDYFRLAAYLLLKCNYGDSQHIQEHKDHYTGAESNTTRRTIYTLWRGINNTSPSDVTRGAQMMPMNLERYCLINAQRNPRMMSTQLTGNTCYFQTYLFGVLCKVGAPTVASDRCSIDLQQVDKLERTTASIARFLLEFFVQRGQPSAATAVATTTTTTRTTLRPLTNSNFILDFHRYEQAPYYEMMISYLRHLGLEIPDYERQYTATMAYYQRTKQLHAYSKFTLSGAMSSTLNTKSLQPVFGTDDAVSKLAQSQYYKYRATNLMFGFNAGIMHGLQAFCEFNSLRKNQLLAFYEQLQPMLRDIADVARKAGVTKYRDYYFMPQYEVGQQELVDVHHYTYVLDACALLGGQAHPELLRRVHAVNAVLAEHIFFSTQKRSNYDKFLSPEEFKASRKYYRDFECGFMSVEWLAEFVGLGFAEINPKEKEINSLTQTVFYAADLMRMQAYRQEYEFEKECINQMARSNLRKYGGRFDGGQDMGQQYRVHVLKVGQGFTYSKYNTLLHFLNVCECYWHNPDLNNIQCFGKDIRTLLALSCQKIFFESAAAGAGGGGGGCEGGGGGYYLSGPHETSAGSSYRNAELDLAVATSLGHVVPSVSRSKRGGRNELVVTDRVYEFSHLQSILRALFERAGGVKLKSDNVV